GWILGVARAKIRRLSLKSGRDVARRHVSSSGENVAMSRHFFARNPGTFWTCVAGFRRAKASERL
ncbi:hypothetical protein A2U01_0110393, partial [Trifolium medium]|nr:hypothetical protein [Trifolium medium]